MYIVGYWLNTPQKVPTNKMRAFVRKSGKIALRRRPSFSFCVFFASLHEIISIHKRWK